MSTEIMIPYMLLGGLGLALIYLFRQLTSYKQLYRNEKSQLESQKEFKIALYSIADGVITTDESGRVRHLNSAAEKLTGWLESEAVGKPAKDVIKIKNEYTNQRVENPIYKIIRDGREPEFVKHSLIIAKDGNETSISDKGAPLLNENNEIVGAVLILRDQTESQKMRNTLRVNQRRVNEFLKNSTILFFEHDINQVITYISPQSVQFLGCDPDEAKTNWTEFITDNPVNVLGYESTMKAIETGKAQPPYILELKKKNGEIIWVEVHEVPILFGGKTVSIVGSLTDITARIKAEEDLHEMNEIFKLFMKTSPIYLFIKDESGKAIYLSDNYTDLLKRPLEDLLNRPMDELFPVHLSDYMMVSDQIVLNEGKTFEIKQELYGRVLNTIKFPIMIKGVPKYVGGYSIDVTAKTKSEERIIALSRAIEQNPVSVLMTDQFGNIIYINPKFSELTGYSFSEVVGKSPRILKSGESSDEDYKILWDTILSGKEWRGEFHNKKKNGELFWTRAIISSITNKEGDIVSLIGIEEDITESKKMIEDLIEAKEKAEEMSRLKSSFLSNMSHELRTPLIGILGYTEMMLSIITNPEQREMAQIVHNSGERLHETLNLILDLSRLESNKMEIKEKPISMDDLLSVSYTLFNKVAAENKLKFILENNTPGLIFYSDDWILESILNNLINNAMKFTNEGSITIKSEIVTHNEKKSLKISVIDTGIGISSENQALIFNEFRQASEGYSRKFEGTGLGLTITRKFAQLLGGEIYLESTLNQGSTFSIILPINQIPKPVKETDNQAVLSAQTKKTTSGKMNILVVDDDEATRNIVPAMLKNLYNVDCVEDGLSALKSVSSTKYDLILLDIGLKGKMDGIEALHKMRKIHGCQDTPIIAFTAYVMKKELERFMASGFNDYLAKPFLKSTLLDVIRRNIVIV